MIFILRSGCFANRTLASEQGRKKELISFILAFIQSQNRHRFGDRVARAAAKNGSGRLIPMHPDLRLTLAAYRGLSPGIGPLIRSERGGAMTPLSIVVWFNRAFRNIGLNGCWSHSGRRTFITRAARLAHKAGGSLRDVQLLAGHRSIQTTQRYIDGDTDAQRKLVSLI